MQEYWLESSGHNKTVDYAFCKIYLSPTAKQNMKEEDVEELEEETVQPRTVKNQQRQPQFYPNPTPLVQFWQATIGSHQMQLHDIAYHEPQPPDTVQDKLPQFWAAPLDSYPPRCHDIQYPQPQPLDAIEYQYLYQSGPLTTYENVIESCTQDKSNGRIKKVDHAPKIHLTPREIKREAEEEEDEKRKRKKKEGGVEASKEELEQLIKPIRRGIHIRIRNNLI
ncbi:hypothetical protein Bca101_028589 [Brassica carinata]